MRSDIFTILLALFFVVSSSCATTGEGDNDAAGSAALDGRRNGASLDGREAGASNGEGVTGEANSESSTGNDGAGSVEDEQTDGEPTQPDTTEIASAIERPEPEPEAGELEPLRPPELRISPENPETEETVSVIVDPSPYDLVTYDFGEGTTEKATHAYSRFGAKTITATVFSGNSSASAQVAFPVRGKAKLRLEKEEVQHDASWKPLIKAQLEADGDFDTIVVYEDGRPVAEIPPPEEYVLPVPFVGERVFTAALFHNGFLVADIDEVILTGLNSPPQRPVYEGPQFISVRVGEEVSFGVTATDPNNNPVRYQVKFAPEGARFDEETGVFTWTPTRERRGVYLLHFTAFDIPYGLASPFTQRGITVQ